MSNKILLTGSCGFIGGNLLRQWMSNDKIISIDRISKPENNASVYNKGHVFHIADLRDRHITEQLLQYEMPEVVVHTAGEQEGEDLFSSNVRGTENLVSACIKSRVAKLIYVSDAKVFSPGVNLTESSPTIPSSIYALSKKSAEDVVRILCQKAGLSYCIVRVGEIYGFRQDVSQPVPKVIRAMVKGERVLLSSRSICPINIGDVGSGIGMVISRGISGEIYNLGASNDISEIELGQKICNAMGRGHELLSSSGKEEEPIISLDNSKIRGLDWEPSWKLTKGIEKIVSWYLANPYYLR
jgi:dTDP-glucose 4,6-dehydratase